jgi:hypothetical protein
LLVRRAVSFLNEEVCAAGLPACPPPIVDKEVSNGVVFVRALARRSCPTGLAFVDC